MNDFDIKMDATKVVFFGIGSIVSIVTGFSGIISLACTLLTLFHIAMLVDGLESKKKVKPSRQLQKETKLLSSRESKRPQLPTTRQEFDCEIYDQASFDLRLHEAGIIKLEDVSICDNWMTCKLCKQEGKRRVEIEKEKRARHRHTGPGCACIQSARRFAGEANTVIKAWDGTIIRPGRTS